MLHIYVKRPDREPDFIVSRSPKGPIGIELHFWFDEMIYCLDTKIDPPRLLVESKDGIIFMHPELDKIVRDALEEYRMTKAFEETILNKSD